MADSEKVEIVCRKLSDGYFEYLREGALGGDYEIISGRDYVEDSWNKVGHPHRHALRMAVADLIDEGIIVTS